MNQNTENTNPEFYENQDVVSEEFQAELNEEIDSAPFNPEEILERIEAHTDVSPADTGADVDADWEDVDRAGSETCPGDNPTPHQSNDAAHDHASAIECQF